MTKFPIIINTPILSSDKECRVINVVNSYIELNDDYFVSFGSYHAEWTEKNEDTGVEEIIERGHYYQTVILYLCLTGVEMYRWHDKALWVVKMILNSNHNNICVLFEKRKEAQNLFEILNSYMLKKNVNIVYEKNYPVRQDGQ